ncbi:MAG: hypothetical protein B5M52_05865 [Helicobacteraceae bacterium 4484_230]|nr:MAG: hypothetical protein B5M52_05865 [Helicobacteraceae bacterium 4484_230]
MLRLVLSIIGSVVITALLFWMLQGMIRINGAKTDTMENIRYINFVRLEEKKSVVEKKRRKKPKLRPKPKKKPKIVKIQKKAPLKTAPKPVVNKPPKSEPPMDLSGLKLLGDAVVLGEARPMSKNYGAGTKIDKPEISIGLIPLVHIEPIYPRKARKLRKQGYVIAKFTITKQGNVKNVTIIEAKPKSFFERAAKRALLQWRFRPKMHDGKPVEQQALQRIDFRLDR